MKLTSKAIFLVLFITCITCLTVIEQHKKFSHKFFEKLQTQKTTATQSSEFELILLDSFNSEAKCLDGSPAGFYWRKGFGEGANNLLFYMQGGGLCFGLSEDALLQDCYKRSLTNLGSTKSQPATQTFDGIFDLNSTINPSFYNWNLAYVLYCDGTLHLGETNLTTAYQNNTLYFRGGQNTISTLNYIKTVLNITNPNTVIISGGSAGGIGTYLWINRIYKSGIWDNTQTQILAAPDSGFFLNYENFGLQLPVLEIMIRTLTGLNEEFQAYLNISVIQPECFQEKNASGDAWKCMLPQYIATDIIPPTFIIQSQYDEWSMQNILGLTCYKNTDVLDSCNSTEQAFINEYRNEIMTNITSILAQKQNFGAWMPGMFFIIGNNILKTNDIIIACILHVFSEDDTTYDSSSWEVPQNSQNTLAYSLGSWVTHMTTGQNHDSEAFRFLDSNAWPSNQGCYQSY